MRQEQHVFSDEKSFKKVMNVQKSWLGCAARSVRSLHPCVVYVSYLRHIASSYYYLEERRELLQVGGDKIKRVCVENEENGLEDERT